MKVDPNPMTGVLMRREKRDQQQWSGDGRKRHLQAKEWEELPGTSKSGRGQEELFSKAFRGSVAQPTLGFRLLGSGTMRE